MSNLSPHQFTAYRGLIVARGPVPESNEEILGHLRPGGDHPFGQHWTTDRKVAERFATNPNAGGYETVPAKMRQFNGQEHYGVVIEGHIHADRALHEQNLGQNAGEREVAPLRQHLESATAHVTRFVMPYESTRARLAGLPDPGKGVQTVRSFEIPPEKWR